MAAQEEPNLVTFGHFFIPNSHCSDQTDCHLLLDLARADLALRVAGLAFAHLRVWGGAGHGAGVLLMVRERELPIEETTTNSQSNSDEPLRSY